MVTLQTIEGQIQEDDTMIGRILRGSFHFVENLRGNLPYGTRRNNNPIDLRMVIETVRYLGIEMTVLLKIQIGNEGVPEIATGLDELVSNHCFSAKVIGRLSKTWAWAVITTLSK